MATRILIAEDESIVAKDIQFTLEALGYLVVEIVATGSAAIEKAESLRPDLILMDIKLRGDTDGIDAAAAIRERWDIPIIYLTAHADAATLQRAKITEPFGYVLKPFEERDLHTTVEMARYKHQMDRKVRENQKWLSVTLASIGDAVIATDIQGRIVFINPVAEHLTGWTADEAIGQPLSNAFHIVNEFTRQPAEDPVAKVLAEGFIVGLANHTVLIARDGTETSIDDSAAPIQSPGGEMLGAVLVFRDISERRQLEQALRQRASDLAEADRRKDEFLAMLAHELRNPLAPILNAVGLLKIARDDEPQFEWAIETIDRQIRNMATLIDDLLDVSRITRAKIRIRKQAVQLDQVISSAVEMSQGAIDARGHELSVLVPQGIMLEADPTRLEQILTNLLNNAAKFTEPGGQITLTARRESDNVLIAVTDNGIGIDPKTLPFIFDLFIQADRTLDRSQGGLGIGLTLVRSLVELHGGTIRASSRGLGEGSEFTIQLPVLSSSAPQGHHELTENVAVGERKFRILVVDDNQDMALTTAKLLARWGHEVHVAHDGASALDAAQVYRPDIVLLDIGLPQGNGYEVVAHLRKNPATAHARILAVSGYGQEEDRQRSQKAGFDMHLTKPLAPEQLRQALDTARARSPKA